MQKHTMAALLARPGAASAALHSPGANTGAEALVYESAQRRSKQPADREAQSTNLPMAGCRDDKTWAGWARMLSVQTKRPLEDPKCHVLISPSLSNKPYSCCLNGAQLAAPSNHRRRSSRRTLALLPGNKRFSQYLPKEQGPKIRLQAGGLVAGGSGVSDHKNPPAAQGEDRKEGAAQPASRAPPAGAEERVQE